jgi:Xaa-Pro aminopeptidase
MSNRRERAFEVAERAGADVLLAAHPATVTWLTGYAPELDGGPSPFALPPVVLLEPDGSVVAVASEDEAPALEALGCRVLAYPGFTIEPLEPARHARERLDDALAGRRAATEPAVLPAVLAEGHALVDASAEIVRARAVKDPDEIERVRAAIRVCDAGQAAARDYACPGITELEVWARVRLAMEAAAGERVPVLADLAAGERTADTGGAPTNYELRDGDLVICDLVPRVAGYWGDSCATIAIGMPSKQAREQHRASSEALARGVAALRPGARAADLDASLRSGLEYPHHTGHGLGCEYHEEPRIVPRGTTVLAAGMVVALEPGSYGAGSGVRCEQICLITDDGCEIMSAHELEL